MVLPDLGLRSLAAADPKEGPTLADALLRQTKLGSTSTAPRDRTPSRSCSRLQWSSLTWRTAVPRSRGLQGRPNIGPCLADANKARIDQHGAAGPDALEVLLKAPMVLPDLEGCGPSQPQNPRKARHWPRPC